ncbi:protein ORF26 [Anguillid herpesvirus 1]|uniref:Protein ORF26 n=1 Tax=Anguillid herpesvirus 1 TaxID=150286 RepID=A0A1J0REC0_9VIRU|nr:protein ORF26 [Anguillid herpesvirus 1]ADA57789.1 protein ORF26 [Anguillid herpesvirus 1]APD76189.1 ORF26 [Anguillid herpesvirus 1]QRM16320.1 protein ORF26 [Anguillid herpesvirus 1]QRM16450.1 protein ORF26 [Anguillid herpesvirus 1]QRM16579.1 protein ORF26 [Anguillid herpesvirus 1]
MEWCAVKWVPWGDRPHGHDLWRLPQLAKNGQSLQTPPRTLSGEALNRTAWIRIFKTFAVLNKKIPNGLFQHLDADCTLSKATKRELRASAATFTATPHHTQDPFLRALWANLIPADPDHLALYKLVQSTLSAAPSTTPSTTQSTKKEGQPPGNRLVEAIGLFFF